MCEIGMIGYINDNHINRFYRGLIVTIESKHHARYDILLKVRYGSGLFEFYFIPERYFTAIDYRG